MHCDTIKEERNFRTCKIYPDVEEIKEDTDFVASQNLSKSYEDADQYLDIQFRMLREECFLPIKTAIQAKQKKQKLAPNIAFYKKITFVKYEALNSCFCVRIKVYRKRRNYASIVVLSHDNFQKFLFGKEYNQTLVKNLEKDEMIIEFDKPVEIGDIQNSSMIEYSTYFEPHFNVLKILQKIDQHTFPMKKYIISLNLKTHPPKYLKNINYEFNLYNHRFSLKNFGKVKDLLNLDDFQLKAFISALSQELAIIQGPPGTGKTYVGVKLVETLLSNMTVWHQQSPLLVICFSNHAVDRFLEDVLKFTDKIIKVGGPITKESLNSFAITGIRHIKNELLWQKLKKGKEIELEVESVSNDLKEMETGNSIINFRAVKDAQIDLKPFDRIDIVHWLLEANENNLKELCQKKKHGLTLITAESLLEKFQKFYKLSTPTDKQNAKELQRKYELLLGKLQFVRQNPTTAKPAFLDPKTMNLDERWSLYSYWLHFCTSKLKEKLEILYQKYHSVYKEFDELRVQEMVKSLKKAHVIGMTTTMAARYGRELEILKCPIIIMEEAAKLLESHVVATVSKECQHLILIGDHQQLKPRAMSSDFEGNRNFTISLFERIVNSSSEYCFLNQHHRLRPEIANLMVPLYPSFEKYPSTIVRPPVKGIESCLFFIDHDDSGVADLSKIGTKFPVFSFFAHLAKYLIDTGYETEDLTVLCAHQDTVHRFKNEFKKEEIIKDVRVAYLDYFQGEESEIVLLYLDAMVGIDTFDFWDKNKISVALSRAKLGLYIFGDMGQLCSDHELWGEMKTIFESNGVIGNKLPLKCVEHNNKLTCESVDDFETIFNEGCGETCNAKLKCGHNCRYKCHIQERKHKYYFCEEDCIRFCEMKVHRCKKKCFETCGICEEVVKTVLPCNHKAEWKCCDALKFKCEVVVNFKLPCGHFTKKLCHHEFQVKKRFCMEVIKTTLPCNHQAILKCGYRLTYKCEVLVTSELPCGHTVQKLCHQNRLNYKCEALVTYELPCGHIVEKLCHQNTLNYKCKALVTSELPCGHFVQKFCHQNDGTIKCETVIETTLMCNHKAKVKCGNRLMRKCKVLVAVTLPCGHLENKLCHQNVETVKCGQPCSTILQCGHSCGKICHFNADPTHVKYVCKKRCMKFMDACSSQSHKCKKLCFEKCELCTVVVDKRKVSCGHTVQVPCHIDAEKVLCEHQRRKKSTIK